MRIFDTDVQKLKYDMLREVARYAYEDRLLDGLTGNPQDHRARPEADHALLHLQRARHRVRAR